MNINMQPFIGATELKVKEKQKKKHKIKRGKIICTCGSLEHFYSSLYYLHDDDCIINKRRNK